MTKAKLQPTDSTILIYLPIQVTPKARPKFSRKSGKAYMPANYRENQNKLIDLAKPQFLDFLAGQDLDPNKFIIGRCQMTITYFGHARGDADNISGSIMDALVKADVLENDNVNTVHDLHFSYGGSRNANEEPCTYAHLNMIDLRPI